MQSSPVRFDGITAAVMPSRTTKGRPTRTTMNPPLTAQAFLAIAFIMAAAVSSSHAGERAPRLILRGDGPTESAPHGQGNVYAPDVMVDGGRLRMWYGGQGKDGHDRIHLAESKDGKGWTRRGVVLDTGSANHVNDPSVVKAGDLYYLYYTRAQADVVDEIALATSNDGLRWEPRGIVVRPGKKDAWDGLLVGRPSVLHEAGLFKMWYDGRKDLPPGSPAANVPKSPESRRAVGHATSKDGIHWTKHPGNPVFGHDAGGVDVKRIANHYVMVYESHEGTMAATSRDGVSWHDRGLWLSRSGEAIDRAGHVTPMLLLGQDGRPGRVFVGAASADSWDHNMIAEFAAPADPMKNLGLKEERTQ